MSLLYFATCERERALDFMKRLYPSVEVTKESAKDVLDFVEADKLRILDPDYHGGGAILGENALPDEHATIIETLNKFNEAHLAKRRPNDPTLL